MGSRKRHKGADKVYEAAQKWIGCALKSDGSLFTPDTAIWTREGLRELREQFLDRPDEGDGGFYDKLEAQLAGSDPEVYQLMGEVLYVHFLIVWHGAMKPATKEAQINRVLRWSTSPVAIPRDLVAGLTPGIAHPGTAFNTYRPYQVGCIIEFAEKWKEESSNRDRLLTDPWEFKNFVIGMRFRSLLLSDHQDTPGIQRHALLHLVHPNTFEGTVSVEQKETIASAKAFQHFVTEETTDIDRKLVQIRQGLEDGLGRDFDFYDHDIRGRWDLSASDPWDEYIRIASEFIDTGRMEGWELSYKFEIGQKLVKAREAVLDDGDNWASLVKTGISGTNLIRFNYQDDFRRWVDGSPDDALKALQTIWAEDNSSVLDRVRAFSNLFPPTVTRGAGTRMTIISVLLMGLDVEQYPPFRFRAFDRAYERTGYDKPAHHNETALYEHALGFLDRFIDEARKRGVPVRHPLTRSRSFGRCHTGNPKEAGRKRVRLKT